MAENEIALLKEQIIRLEENKFDLEAWKNRTIIFLERIFGTENSKVRMIKDLHYDYSSWSLRDATGAGKAKDPVKMQANEILSAIIVELEFLGLPQETEIKNKVRELLEDELTGKQIKKIDSLLKSNSKNKQEQISEIIEDIEKDGLAALISKLLLS